jgi:uncharacterized membrane-anchored protein
MMPPIKDHPMRYRLANEMHARPFPVMSAPCAVSFIAIKCTHDAVTRDKALDLAHLTALLERHGAPAPEPGATHWYGQIGQHWLKWEQHTEFVTYTAIREGACERPFDPAQFEVFPADWLETAPGQRLTSALLHIAGRPEDEAVLAGRLDDWFVSESLAVSKVLDDAAVVAGDFRIDLNGHLRFAIFPSPETGRRRVGRIVQRLCEVETYKAMSMLGFARARGLQADLNSLDSRLTGVMSAMTDDRAAPEATLQDLLQISAQLETIAAQSAFRFDATGAYEALVNQRIEALREMRFKGRQSFAEFMMRRYEPAMRTVKTTRRRLASMSDRSVRASNLLRTRVDVARSAQNQALLESMDRRSDLQLRLQHTVEGLSVVAISYYAVSLAGYLAYPLAQAAGLSKSLLLAIVTLPIVGLVWTMIRRLRAKVK